MEKQAGYDIKIMSPLKEGSSDFSPTCHMFPFGLNCLQGAPLDEIIEGGCAFCDLSICQPLLDTSREHALEPLS